MKEDLIIEWFQSWFDSHWNNFEVIFESDAYYSESWGPEYKGIIEIKKWFNDWHEHFKLDNLFTLINILLLNGTLVVLT